MTLSSASDQPTLFTSPSFTGTSGTLSGGSAGTFSPATIYGYSIPTPATSTTGYAGNGNLLSYSDQVNGQWSASYDTLNRLSTATITANPNVTYSWIYDSFGNRESQSPNGDAVSYAPGNNRILTYTYDAAGNVQDDGSNQYGYDGEGRVCVVYNETLHTYTG